MKKLKCLFMGTPDFSVATLQALSAHSHIDLKLVVSMPDRPAGRGQQSQSPAVIEFCKTHHIEFHQTDNINQDAYLIELVEALDLDFIVVLAFAQFLNKKWLGLPRFGCFNIHTSLLPLYRGAAPIQYALLNNDKITGVTIQKMVSKMDAGDILFQKETSISDRETGETLTEKLKLLAATSCSEFIYLLADNSFTITPQDHSKASFAPTLSREMGLLDFEKQSAESIEIKTRALYPWPGTFCFMNNKRLKIFQVKFSEESRLAPGVCHITGNNELLVGTTTKTLRVEVFQVEGKKLTSDQNYFRTVSNKSAYTLSPRQE